MPSQNEIRQRITEQFIEALERGGMPPWRRGWSTHPSSSGLPVNAVSQRRYSGINVLLLQMHRQRHGLDSKFYATFNQWQDMGCQIKPRPNDVPPGSWACGIVYFKPIRKVDHDESGEEKEAEIRILKHYSVFSADQVVGEAAQRYQTDEAIGPASFVDYEPAERAIEATRAVIRFGGDRAYYRRPSLDGAGDYICCPPRHRFSEPKEYYGTLLHELGHWSEVRLGWSGSYAEGELRAEIAAAMTSAELGVPQSDDLSNAQSYVAHWLKLLQEDPRFLFRASTDASKACDYLLSFSRSCEPVAGTDAVLTA
jgi:antirestriction protein ArdC